MTQSVSIRYEKKVENYSHGSTKKLKNKFHIYFNNKIAAEWFTPSPSYKDPSEYLHNFKKQN